MIKHLIKILLASLIILWSGCSTTRVVKPLNKGETRVSVDLGGPIVGYPLPITSIAGAYGISEKLSLFGGFHFTTLAYNSLQFDLGANYSLIKPNKWQPGITGSLILNPVIDMRVGNSSWFPETGLNFYWVVKEKHIPFVAITNWYDLGFQKTELEKGKLLHPTVCLGDNYEAPKWVFGIETKWLNFNKQLHVPQVEQTTINGNGAVGLYFKAAYRINKVK